MTLAVPTCVLFRVSRCLTYPALSHTAILDDKLRSLSTAHTDLAHFVLSCVDDACRSFVVYVVVATNQFGSVDADTEILRPMAREHIGHAGKGRTCRNAGIRVTRCGTLALGKETGAQSKARTSIGGISLQNPLSENLAMRLRRYTAVDDNVHPVDLESIATVHGANCLVQAFRRQIIANVGECTDKSRPHGSVPDTRCHSVTIWTTMKPQCAVNRGRRISLLSEPPVL